MSNFGWFSVILFTAGCIIIVFLFKDDDDSSPNDGLAMPVDKLSVQ